jgi:hypothetical protein
VRGRAAPTAVSITFEPRLHRTPYGEPIRAWVGKPVIKALIGMRRTGKSFLLRQAG